jgi:TolB-like protein/Tfp pilus assembly protein PilF
LGNLFGELKRRNVIRVAIAYAVAAWIVLQVADLVLDNIGAPHWVMQAFLLLMALGFPLVLIFSWAYELTPEGLRRERDVDRSTSMTHLTARKLDRLTIGFLILVLLVLGVERLLPRAPDAAAPATAATPTTAATPERSIAVLAFKDLSPNGDQEYFAEGISEELLNVLAQVPGLKVAGRTSSFAFKDQNRDLREIGEILEVANILEGSVRTSGDHIRVTAQLVKAADGFHLFSRNYDRKLTDIFIVQDEIAAEIGVALQAAIMGEKPIEQATPTNVEAYDRYLQARQWIHTRDPVLMEQASDLLDEALRIDPDYAPALAQKALVLLLLSNLPGSYGDIPSDAALRMSKPLLDRALAIDAELADAWAILGLWQSSVSATHSPDAIVSLRKALSINPSLSNAKNWLATELGVDSYQESRQIYESIVANDPLYRPAFNNLTFTYLGTREIDKADALIRRVERFEGDSPSVRFSRGATTLISGRLADSMADLQKAYEYNPNAGVIRLWYGIATMFIGDYETAIEAYEATDKLPLLQLSGRNAEAQAIFDNLQVSVLSEEVLIGIGDWMLMDDRPEDFIAYVQKLPGDASDWIERQPRPQSVVGSAHWNHVALALQRTGDEENAARVLREVRVMLDAQRALGADNLFYWVSEAEYAAMSGDRDGMVSNLRRAMETGWVSVTGFFTPAFDRYRADSQFKAVEQESIQRANAERRKLGFLEM